MAYCIVCCKISVFEGLSFHHSILIAYSLFRYSTRTHQTSQVQMQFLRVWVYICILLTLTGLYLKYLTLLLVSLLKVKDVRGKFLNWYLVLISAGIPDNYATFSMILWGNISLQNFGHIPEVYVCKSLYFRPFQCKDFLDLYCIDHKEYKRKFVEN